MRVIITALWLALSLAATPAAFADSETTKAEVVTVDSNVSCDELKADGASGEVLAQQGCCSHHDGVCGCSGGRTKCCDGTLSPSCTCYHDDKADSVPRT